MTSFISAFSGFIFTQGAAVGRGTAHVLQCSEFQVLTRGSLTTLANRMFFRHLLLIVTKKQLSPGAPTMEMSLAALVTSGYQHCCRSR